MKKKDFVLLLVVLVITASLFGLRAMKTGSISASHVLIEVNSKVFARIPLTDPQTVTIAQPSGAINIVNITEQGAVMAFSSCDNQLCIHQGEVTLGNYETRPTQGYIICLPNRVTVELIPEVQK